jgi:hypothetical protein
MRELGKGSAQEDSADIVSRSLIELEKLLIPVDTRRKFRISQTVSTFYTHNDGTIQALSKMLVERWKDEDAEAEQKSILKRQEKKLVVKDNSKAQDRRRVRVNQPPAVARPQIQTNGQGAQAVKRFHTLEHPTLPTTLFVRFIQDESLDRTELRELLADPEFGLRDVNVITSRGKKPCRMGRDCRMRVCGFFHEGRDKDKAFVTVSGRECEKRAMEMLRAQSCVERVEPQHYQTHEGVLLVKLAEIKDYPVTPRNR